LGDQRVNGLRDEARAARVDTVTHAMAQQRFAELAANRVVGTQEQNRRRRGGHERPPWRLGGGAASMP
jgi:hypothetical protein